MSARGVSLVVPNYNGAELLREHVPTLLAAAEAYPGPAEVVIVDDGSQDASRQVVEGELAPARLVVHPQNRGFGPACKTGVEAAAHEVVVLLNSDVSVEPDFLAPLLEHFADPDVFSVSPLILDRAGEPSKVSVNHPYVRRGDLKWRGVDPQTLLRLGREPGRRELLSLFGLGGAIALSRARFLELGGFDPLYRPFYHEDVDLGLMAWRRGWKVLVDPRSRVQHLDGGTINRFHAPFRVRVARRRHRLLCGWKHAEGAWRRAQRWGLWGRICTRWLKLDLRFYWALASALGRWGEARRARRRELAATKVALLEVFPRIAASWPED
ncbi:MAG: glycosyltransferase [Planctomycetota bacterium]